ncbi:MAG: sugar transferase, partial [Clostridia bacterium]|nr:sugar transferase [Clostridia bacterium]
MYRRRSSGWLKHADFMLIDLLCLHIAFVLSYVIRHGFGNPYVQPLYRNMAIFVTLADLTVVLLFGSYRGILRRSFSREFISVLRHTLTVFLFSVLYLFYVQESYNYSRITLYLMWGIYLLLSLGGRCLRKYVITHGKGQHSLLLVTTSDLAEEIAAQFDAIRYEQARARGIAVVDRDMRGETISGIPVVADRETVVDYVCHEWVDEVFTAFGKPEPYQKRMVDKFVTMGVTVHEKLNYRSEEL